MHITGPENTTIPYKWCLYHLTNTECVHFIRILFVNLMTLRATRRQCTYKAARMTLSIWKQLSVKCARYNHTTHQKNPQVIRRLNHKHAREMDAFGVASCSARQHPNHHASGPQTYNYLHASRHPFAEHAALTHSLALLWIYIISWERKCSRLCSFPELWFLANFWWVLTNLTI